MAGDLEDIDDEHYIKYYGTLKKIKADNPPDVADLPEGTKHLWYFGNSGTGKSFAARQEHPVLFDKAANTKWWCGYNNEETVLIDDFDKSHAYMGFHLKRWADRYKFPAETKGSNVKSIRPKLIIVTSNWDMTEIWKDDPNTLNPLLRRFKRVRFRSLAERMFDEIDNGDVVDREGFDPSASYAPNFTPTIPQPILTRTGSLPFANEIDDFTFNLDFLNEP